MNKLLKNLGLTYRGLQSLDNKPYAYIFNCTYCQSTIYFKIKDYTPIKVHQKMLKHKIGCKPDMQAVNLKVV